MRKKWIRRALAAACAAMAAAVPSSVENGEADCIHSRIEYIVEYEPENRRIREAERCLECGVELSEYYAADAGFTGGEIPYDGLAHRFNFFNNSAPEITVFVRCDVSPDMPDQTFPPEFTEPGEYTLSYEVDYSFFYSTFTETGTAVLTILPPAEPEPEPEPEPQPEPGPDPQPEPEPLPRRQESVGHQPLFFGDGEGLFRPDDELTRSELAALACRALGLEPEGGVTAFTDVPEDAWYAPCVSALSARGVMVGTGGGLFCPDRAVTAAELKLVAERMGALTELRPPPLPESGTVTRAQAAEIFAALLGRDGCPGPGAPAPFPDVSPEDDPKGAVSELSLFH